MIKFHRGEEDDTQKFVITVNVDAAEALTLAGFFQDQGWEEIHDEIQERFEELFPNNSY
jgi:hypothetical protein